MASRSSPARAWPPRLLRGPAPALPRPLDALAERWARLPPRMRMAAVGAALALLALGAEARVQAAEARWGGAPVTALVATADLPVGAAPTGVAPARLPPSAVPPEAVDTVPARARLAFALPRGSVLTARHLDGRGPGAGLADGQRVLPVPVEAGWAVTAGGWVDVWVLGTEAEPARRVGRSRPVLDVRVDEATTTALVGLDVDEVAPTTTALAVGRVVLAHAPPPAGQADEADEPDGPREPGGEG